MEQIEFNLLENPWIRVMTDNCTVSECSLVRALTNSHDCLRLAGEVPTQDVAVLRLLLAVLHTVFYRFDLNGNADPIQNPRQAVDRWRQLWQAGRLPEKPICEYLLTQRDKFWLFHPDDPFYQVPEAKNGTEYTVAKLNGEISESNNKARLFPLRAKEGKQSLTYAEAARWLLYVNGFDDTSAKPKGKGLPSSGAGWLGKLGLIYAEGKNLFETLMLNLALLKDGNQIWGEPKPVWERQKPKSAERTEIAMPDNQAELLTLQSRRLLLERQNGTVVKCRLLGGDFFSKINAFSEQMTLWSRKSESKNSAPYDQPRRQEPDRQMWRSFGIITGTVPDGRTPGIVSWIARLKQQKILDRGLVIRFRTAGVKYGDKDFFAEDIISDHLDFHADLLEQAGTLWNEQIRRQIERIDKAAELLGKLAGDIYTAEGGQSKSSTHDAQKRRAEQDYYAAADIPFRKWLESVDPTEGDGEALLAKKDREWRQQAYRLAALLGQKMVETAGTAAFSGHWIDESFYSSARAFNRFKAELGKCFDIKALKKEEADE